ncbi:hypothetical protein WJX73_002933 [Symbiochloris irregularis]|uniref:Splicing factor 45 n=1 Tax=Symbiochloris irregularis TaxID=706552 RepID=A0AAW1PYL2_9CHLO
MLGGLYGDLPQAKSGGSKPQPSPRTSDHGDAKGQVAAAGSQFSLGGNLQDEYDPAKPNEYEEVVAQRQAERQEAAKEAARQERLKQEAEAAEEASKRMGDAAGAAEPGSWQQPPAPDPSTQLDISGEEAFLRRGRGRQAKPSGFSDADGGTPQAGNTPAERMMQAMGWKEGQGLGRGGQGMTTPLVAKSDGRAGAGVIVNAEERARSAAAAAAQPPDKRQRTGVAIRGTPTRVVLLRNMVGPGDVDEDLEDEVGNECSKYGNIQRVVIFEVTEPNYPDEQAVRIFVEFDRVESATKSLVDLEGRFFGGRNIRATFYDESKFERDEVAPFPGED